MKKRMLQITCPLCHHPFYILRDTMLLLDESGIEHERLMNSGFFAHQCSECRKLFNMEYPLLIHDAKRSLCLILSDSESLPEIEDRTIIRTKNTIDFQLVYQAVILNLPLPELAAMKKQLTDTGYFPKKLVSVNARSAVFESESRLIEIHRN